VRAWGNVVDYGGNVGAPPVEPPARVGGAADQGEEGAGGGEEPAGAGGVRAGAHGEKGRKVLIVRRFLALFTLS
jgi:hypothetical protein